MDLLRYAKGARSERELISLFCERGFSVIRAAGSGVSSLCPDILVFRKGVQYAFECKAWESGSLSIERDKFRVLKDWENNTGITTFIAWRIGRVGWRFVYLDELEENPKSYTITMKRTLAIDRGLERLL
ncbi:MAG: Holliday junction resolvase Hjc [Candidatus Fermentimicrarchaeum limneticum]|uniref:Holliday junction resolvase Hjc n=1 Tax=Fermentimicrarchaeum limneticum TaxID=2795018 RepID=A0A7D5XCM4_FERL1|nr:MAG: Holliday junction resolvase Hjc [Candidatus Fermentimicrarchaeum limneticum]